ncbi:MAG: ATP-dependent helicase [Thermoguttaceae bacterium]
MDDLLQGLNPSQCEAVCHDDGPLLVLAGPGSGKTRVVTHRLARLLRRGVYPNQLAALTFTNKAAEEMHERLQKLAPSVADGVWVGTFHRFCGRILRTYAEFVGLDRSFVIYDADDALKLLTSLIRKDDLPSGITPKKIQTAISYAKNQLVLPDEYEPRNGSTVGSATAEVYSLYQETLKRQNAVDFDDMLLHVAILLRDHADIRERLDRRFRYILVDEYQDTNAVQYAILKLLARDFPNLAVTGDPDQSIYGWRGADIENILRFEHDFPSARIVKLEQNYRSTPQILGAASSLIRHNKQRKDKGLHTANAAGNPVRLVKYADQQAEAEYIAAEIAREVASGSRRPSDYAIFYRTNVLSRNLEHALRREGVPFRLIRGLEFYARAEIKDVLAYLRLLSNPASDVALTRIVNVPTRGIGKTTLQKCEGLAREREISLLDALRAAPSVFKLAAKTAGAIRGFVRTIDELTELAASGQVEPVIRAFLDKTKFLAQFQPDESEEDGERVANIEELLTVAREFDDVDNADTGDEVVVTPLSRFLEQTALVSDVDALSTDNAVSLMTLHAAKGLEFPVVYLIAVEEGILPHERSLFEESQMEEERRLLFVGITRAKADLRLCYVEVRASRGQVRHTMASSFLFELPLDQFEIAGDAASQSLATDESVPAWKQVVLERSFAAKQSRRPVADEYSQEVASEDGIDDEYDDEGRIVTKTRTRKQNAF